MSSQTRRDRPSRTCRQCKRRKVKCDRTHPTCAQCLKVRIQCSYDDDDLRPREKDFKFINETSRTAEASAGTSRELSEEAPIGNGIIGHLSQQPGGRLRYVEPSFWAFDKDEPDALDSLLSSMNRYGIQGSNEDRDDDLEQPQSSGASTVSATVNPNDTRPSIPYRLMGDFTSPAPAWNPSMLSTSRLQRQSINPLTLLPPKALCDRLFAFYLEGYHYVLPMIHAPSFKSEYSSTWEQESTGQRPAQKSMHFISLLLSVLFAGAAACPHRDLLEDLITPEETPESLATSIREKGLRTLQQANFPKTPTLETLTAYILLQVTWMKEEEPLTTCAFVGLAYRVSQMLGMHHDPSRFSSLSKVVQETRRRLWWIIVTVDVSVGVAAGLPPMIDLSTCDVRQVSDMSEEVFDVPEGNFGRNQEVSVPGFWFSGTIKDILVTRHVLSKIYGQHALSRQDIIDIRTKCGALTAELLAKINLIPKTPLVRVDTIPISHEHASERSPRNINAYARLYLSAMIDKKWFLACHPVLKSAVSESWTELYPQALEHCRDFLYKVAQLSCFDEFKLFQWSWPGQVLPSLSTLIIPPLPSSFAHSVISFQPNKTLTVPCRCHQPLFALITLLHSLIRSPSSPLAPSFRHALDTVFALCGPYFNGGIVASTGGAQSPSDSHGSTRQRPLTEGGQECWTLLWRMRARAWTLVGLDPDVIWTRELAMEVLYTLYEQEHWDEGLMLSTAGAWNPPSQTPSQSQFHSQPQTQHQSPDHQDRDRSHSSQANPISEPQPYISDTSLHMNLSQGLPRHPSQPTLFSALSASDPGLFDAMSHSQGASSGPAGDAIAGMGVGVGPGIRAESLGDPNMPTPNVDLMFWDQMLDEGFYGAVMHGNVGLGGGGGGGGDGGGGIYTGGEGVFGRSGSDSGMYGGSGGAAALKRSSRMEGNTDFQGGRGRGGNGGLQ
ncbi:hypothetical protein BDZ45DRAFT_810000 [Acephala macrosclerotiorum]|nr:hypothetical protein BDZ45DRAFT_810000 [Acephala macrosclerotiorum]